MGRRSGVWGFYIWVGQRGGGRGLQGCGPRRRRLGILSCELLLAYCAARRWQLAGERAGVLRLALEPPCGWRAGSHVSCNTAAAAAHMAGTRGAAAPSLRVPPRSGDVASHTAICCWAASSAGSQAGAFCAAASASA